MSVYKRILEYGEPEKVENKLAFKPIDLHTGSVVEDVSYGPYQAVIPEVEGSAFITGFHTFVLNPNDPFSTGFILR